MSILPNTARASWALEESHAQAMLLKRCLAIFATQLNAFMFEVHQVAIQERLLATPADMFSRTKKRKRWGFRTRSPSKGTVLESSPPTTEPERGAQEASANNTASGSGSASKARRSTKEERHASKILSWLRSWRTGAGEDATTPPAQPARANAALPTRENTTLSPEVDEQLTATDEHSNTSTSAADATTGQSHLNSLTDMLAPPANVSCIYVGPLEELSSSCQDEPKDRRPGPSLQIPADARVLRSSRSSPWLSHVLGHKLSSSFFNPTVVRHRKLQSRPSVRSLYSTSKAFPESYPPEATAVETTDQSSMTASGNPSSSPTGISTAQTSVLSDMSGRAAGDKRQPVAKTITKAKSLSTVLDFLPTTALSPIPETSISAGPSITTVEITASAKIFFETHFNNIFTTEVTPRSQRRRALEERMTMENMTSEMRAKALRDWARRESEQLRQLRSMKTKGMGNPGPKGVFVGGYEVVRVLGKGSFGVVRLVKETKRTREPLSAASMFSHGRYSEGTSGASSGLLTGATRPSRSPLKNFRGQSASQIQNRVYAMKVIRKSDMLRNSQEAHLRAERDFLVASEGSRWIVPLIASFQDHTNLYLVMEYMVGGDFLGLLIREHILDEDVTKWYIAEMIMCIEEAHALQWIHRDVKPDNFLISASGHLKISDFGLAFDGHWAHDQAYFNDHRRSLMEKLGITVKGDSVDREEAMTRDVVAKIANVMRADFIEEENVEGVRREEDAPKENVLDWRNRSGMRPFARSVVGTSQYMAPEVIRGDVYDGRCDWWSLGIILYECLYGFTPFCMDNRNDTKRRVLQHATSLKFPSEISVSDEVMDLMRSLLQEKEFRLSCRKYRVNDFHFPGPYADDAYFSSSTNDPSALYVHPNDATEIKAHEFFKGTPWANLHLMRPPFVPKVKSWEDTRYFDEEESLSDMENSSSLSSAPDASRATRAKASAARAEEAVLNADDVDAVWDSPKEKDDVKIEPNPKESRQRKRPRDRVLRDRGVARHVLDLRKRSAFLGYTYRRPEGVENERARTRVDTEDFWRASA